MTAASELYAVTPTPRRVRVTGSTGCHGCNPRSPEARRSPSEIVTALWDGEEPVETLREFFNRDVVVEGVGVFRPSGSLLRVDADAIVLASSQDEFFRRVPSAAAKRDYHKLARLKAGEKSAYAQLRGWLPSDDEDFNAAVVALC